MYTCLCWREFTLAWYSTRLPLSRCNTKCNAKRLPLPRQVRQVALLGLPRAVGAHPLPGADHHHGRVLLLDRPAGHNVALRQRPGHQVLLQLGKDGLAALVRRPAPHAVLAAAAPE